jgi:anti-anti-sigma factor
MIHQALKNLAGPVVGVSEIPVGTVLDDSSIGRIEEWVVCTLDDRTQNQGESDWMTSLDGLSLTKRSPRTRSTTSSTESEPIGWARFRLSHRRGVTIVSLTDQALIKEADLLELTGDLRALVEAGHRRIVLDFFAVERLSSWAARLIDDAVRSCGSVEGTAVKFSGLTSEVMRIFAMTGLDPIVALYPDTASAVAGVWSDLPDLRPLPVSILSALLRAEETRSSRSPRPGSTAPIVEDHRVMTTAHLVIQGGRKAGQPIEIKGAKFLIGRAGECDLLVKSSMASRSHATIERRGTRYFLRDLGSTNGTLLNGRILWSREAEIHDGAKIRVGNLTFVFRAVRSSTTAVLHEEVLPELFPMDDSEPEAESEPTRTIETHDVTEEFLDISELGQELGLKSEVIEGVLVVTPLAADLDDEAEVDAFRNALISLSLRKLPNRVVLNLMNLGHLSGRAIGVLVGHHLRLGRSGGALRVCLANPRVAVVLEQIKLGMLVDYHKTVEDAVITAWPEPTGLADRS